MKTTSSEQQDESVDAATANPHATTTTSKMVIKSFDFAIPLFGGLILLTHQLFRQQSMSNTLVFN